MSVNGEVSESRAKNVQDETRGRSAWSTAFTGTECRGTIVRNHIDQIAAHLKLNLIGLGLVSDGHAECHEIVHRLVLEDGGSLENRIIIEAG